MIKRIKKTLKPPYSSKDVFIIGLTSFSLFLLPTAALSVNRVLFAGDKPVSFETPSVGKEQIIVKLKKEAYKSAKPYVSDEETARKIVSKYAKSRKVVKEFKELRKEKRKSIASDQRFQEVFTVEIENGKDLRKAFEKLKKDKLVESVQWNYKYTPDLTPNDPLLTQQYSHVKTRAVEGWNYTTGNTGVVIAVVGTGVKWDHEDLAANIWSNSRELLNGIDDDSNGFIDDLRGWNFELNNNNPTDQNGHDTGVAGVAAAVSNNGKGVAGVCWKCKIMPIRVAFTSSQVAGAINYATANGAKVINMSFGNYDINKYGPDTIVEAAINNAVANGVMVIATAGNDSVNTKRYPGALESVIGVASTDFTDRRSSFSNWGEWVDVAAPGSSIASTTLSGYGLVSGTSYSAPYVAGLAGLIFSKNPSISLQDAKMIVEYTVDKLSVDRLIGSGRINALKAVSANSAPNLFALVKSPLNNGLLPPSGFAQIWGTALGTSYVLEYKNETTWTQFAAGTQTVNGPLGNFDVINSRNPYTQVRLTAKNGTATDTSVVNLIPDQGFHQGFPKDLGRPVLSSVNVADINDDGQMEMIVGNHAGDVHVLNKDGNELPGWPKQSGGSFVFGIPAVGDVDGDGKADVVVSAMKSVMAWNASGAPLPGWPKHPAGNIRGSVALVNLDEDRALEIVAAEAGSSDLPGNGSYVHAWNGDGSVVGGWPVNLKAPLDYNLQTAPAFYFEGNEPRVVVVSAGSTNIISKSGQLLFTRNTGTDHTSPVLADIDGDSKPDIITAKDGYILVRKLTGEVIWQKVGSWSYDQLALGDLDNDGKIEIVNATKGANSTVYVYDSTGKLLNGWPKSLGEGGGEPSIGDVDGDGYQDVVVTSQAGKVYAWKASGALIQKFPLGTGSVVYSAATIADIDLDGKVEIAVGAENGYLYVWDLTSAYRPNSDNWAKSRKDLVNSAHLILSGVPASPVPTPAPLPSPSPSPASSADSDGDGFSDDVERYLGTNPNKACITDQAKETDSSLTGLASLTWPADVYTKSGGPFGIGANKLDIQDITDFLAPVRRLDAKSGDANFVRRYDLNADGEVSRADIEIINNLHPPMFNGQRAFNGPVCSGF